MSYKQKGKYSLFYSWFYVVLASLIMTIALPFKFLPFVFKNDIINASLSRLDNHSKNEIINILFLGFDRKASRIGTESIFRPDTIMIVSVNQADKKVSLVSIPRDSYMRINGSDQYDKINHAYVQGYLSGSSNNPHQDGLTFTIDSVSDFLGASQIDFYVATDIDGAALLIDLIGGIYFSQDQGKFLAIDTTSDHAETNLLHLDGKEAVDYVRNRADYLGGEIGRIDRQQYLLLNVFKKMKQTGIIKDLNSLIILFAEITDTNMNQADIIMLKDIAVEIDPDEIALFLFDGDGTICQKNGQNSWFYVIKEESYLDIVINVFNQDREAVKGFDIPAPCNSDW